MNSSMLKTKTQVNTMLTLYLIFFFQCGYAYNIYDYKNDYIT